MQYIVLWFYRLINSILFQHCFPLSRPKMTQSHLPIRNLFIRAANNFNPHRFVAGETEVHLLPGIAQRSPQYVHLDKTPNNITQTHYETNQMHSLHPTFFMTPFQVSGNNPKGHGDLHLLQHYDAEQAVDGLNMAALANITSAYFLLSNGLA